MLQEELPPAEFAQFLIIFHQILHRVDPNDELILIFRGLHCIVRMIERTPQEFDKRLQLLQQLHAHHLSDFTRIAGAHEKVAVFAAQKSDESVRSSEVLQQELVACREALVAHFSALIDPSVGGVFAKNAADSFAPYIRGTLELASIELRAETAALLKQNREIAPLIFEEKSARDYFLKNIEIAGKHFTDQLKNQVSVVIGSLLAFQFILLGFIFYLIRWR